MDPELCYSLTAASLESLTWPMPPSWWLLAERSGSLPQGIVTGLLTRQGSWPPGGKRGEGQGQRGGWRGMRQAEAWRKAGGRGRAWAGGEGARMRLRPLQPHLGRAHHSCCVYSLGGSLRTAHPGSEEFKPLWGKDSHGTVPLCIPEALRPPGSLWTVIFRGSHISLLTCYHVLGTFHDGSVLG